MSNVWNAIDQFNKEGSVIPPQKPTSSPSVNTTKPPPNSSVSAQPSITQKPQLSKTTETKHRDTTVPRYHDTALATIRKAVKCYGKEAATYRFTIEEKRAMQAIIFAYKQQGIHTSESQITRIGLNAALEEYRALKDESIISKLIRDLNQ